MNTSQHLSYLISSLVHSFLWLFILIAVAVFAAIAAWRHKLKGLWILAAATLLTTLHDILSAVLDSMAHAGHDVMVYQVGLTYIPFLTVLVVLCGWCVLAFCRKKGATPDA